MKALWMATLAAVLGSCGPTGMKIESLKQAAVEEDKRTALTAIGAIYETAPWHQEMIEKVAVLAASSPHNTLVFPGVASLMARCGYQTMVLYGVAEAAARSRLELPEFSDLAELAVLKLSETQSVVDLAEEAARIADPAEVPVLREKIAILRAGADCQTVDEAIRKVDSLLKGLNTTVKK